MFFSCFSWNSDLFLLCFGVLQIFKDFYGFLQKREEGKGKREEKAKKKNKRERDRFEGKDFLKFRKNVKNKIKIGIR